MLDKLRYSLLTKIPSGIDNKDKIEILEKILEKVVGLWK